MAVFLLLLFLGASSAGASASVSTKEIEESLTCQCGCGLTVHSCNHLQCGSGIPLKQEVQTLVSQGLSQDEILLHFRDKYGEKILSSPTTEGFNLTAWILPFVVVAAGAVAVVASLRHWARQTQSSDSREPSRGGEPAGPKTQLSESDRRRLDAELAKSER